MKKVIFFLMAIVWFSACKDDLVQKPANLIAEDKMVEIIHDLSILEAMRSQHQQGQENLAINPNQYIYKKYSIDSLQFAQSNHYYAADISNYKKMYDKVSKRIAAEQVQADAAAKKSGTTVSQPVNPDTPQIK